MNTDEEHVAKGDFDAIADDEKLIAWEPRIPVLTDLDMDALLDAIANPPPPNAAMLRSIARWREAFAPE